MPALASRSRRARPALLLALLLAPFAVSAQGDWPTRPIRFIVPFAPGGSNDAIARYIAPHLAKALGQTVVIDNRAGGGSIVGAQALAVAAPDGQTFLFGSGSLAAAAAVQKTPYDPVKAFDFVTRVGVAPLVIVSREDFPAKTVKDLIAYAKASPGKVTYGTGGTGNTNDLVADAFAHTAGIQLTPVGYKGMGPALIDLVGRRIDIIVVTMASVRGSLADKLPKIAITSDQRDPDFPSIPTVRESGIDFSFETWWGVFAPAGIPAAIRDRMNREIRAVISIPEVVAFLKNNGATPAPSAPQLMRDLYLKDLARWTESARRNAGRQ